ncbi:sensor histidine kinase [Sphingomonas sp.]|uniref:sensor histidine kinase n=1 Tax=Sphingomonas sp. TaxID=28214 RepID=UPI0031E09FF0
MTAMPYPRPVAQAAPMLGSPQGGESGAGPQGFWPDRRGWLILALYAAGFAMAHRLAALWGGSGFYSLWFPAAGVRLALLWRLGPRITPMVALVEILVDVGLGHVTLTRASAVTTLWGIARPVLAYGLTVAAIRWLAGTRRAGLFTAPMPLGLAAVLAPLAAALCAVPQALFNPELTGVANGREIIVSLAAFTVGDLLGTLFVAPPLLWIADALGGPRRWPGPLPTVAACVETAGVLVLGLALVELLAAGGLGIQPAPVLVAVAWIGLRRGRAAVWTALLVVVLIVLPATAGAMDTPARLQQHLALATVVVTGYLAGSFADAQAAARASLERRDRLLFQAERLKTLRAMSVAVIHELSQPLSTLAIEARHLRRRTEEMPGDIADSAALIDRQADRLTTLIRRLRRFGGHADANLQPVALATLMETVAQLAKAEAREAGVILTVPPVDPAWRVMAQEVELAQAVMNLMRNAIAAARETDHPVVIMTATRQGAWGAITVVNATGSRPAGKDGMGIGTFIARAIMEAHGGTLTRVRQADGMVVATLSLPLVQD